MNITTASKISGISTKVLKAKIEKGTLPASYTRTGAARIDLTDLELFCENMQHNPARNFAMYPYLSRDFYSRLMFYVYGEIVD